MKNSKSTYLINYKYYEIKNKIYNYYVGKLNFYIINKWNEIIFDCF